MIRRNRQLAFPAHHENYNKGMSLWDYFYAHAPITLEDVFSSVRRGRVKSEKVQGEHAYQVLAKMRVEYADAMMKERHETCVS